MHDVTDPAPMPPLFGLVLAGGESRRMGRDKGAVPFGGEPQVRRAWRLLNNLCVRTYVSVRAAQVGEPAYSGLPLILDDAGRGGGPAAGLSAAWRRYPEVAWLALATDMPLVDASVVGELLRARDPARFAAAFRQADGTLQPLCAIWEPAARPEIEARIAAGDRSLRRVLETAPIAETFASEPDRLCGVNTAAELASAERREAEAARKRRCV